MHVLHSWQSHHFWWQMLIKFNQLGPWSWGAHLDPTPHLTIIWVRKLPFLYTPLLEHGVTNLTAFIVWLINLDEDHIVMIILIKFHEPFLIILYTWTISFLFQSLLANGPSHPQNKYMKLENEFERSNQRFAEDNYQEQQVNEWCTILGLSCTVSQPWLIEKGHSFGLS